MSDNWRIADSPPQTQHSRGTPLLWRVFLPNAVVLILAGVALAVSPATVSSPVAPREVIVVGLGLIVMLVVNLALLRRAVAPLERLARTMREIDPLSPGGRVEVSSDSAEVAELTAVFNAMIERLEDERRDSALRMLAAQEDERRRVARELHDEITQQVTALMLQVRELADDAPPAVESRLRETQEEMRALSGEVQQIVRRLRPEALDDLGLTSALSSLASGFSARSGIEVVRRFQRDLPALSSEEELVVYRVTQEALTNVARHSGADAVEVALAADGRRLVLSVSDGGCGMNGAPAGTGITGMRERALLVGGRLALISPPRGGTTVRLEVPLERSA
jgi:two-component system, NarL family, sensor histidine kinase UhpB